MSKITLITLLLTLTGLLAAEGEFIWQQKQAERLPGGKLQWSPKPYQFEAGSSQRYIDFEEGDDHADGRSPETAWKHHPWDAQATGLAQAAAQERHTYVFKRGVIYRGQLQAQASGTEQEPIRLCSDPSWGEGQAALHGALRIYQGWKRVTSAPKGIPNADQVWVVDIGGLPQVTALWEMQGESVERVHLARTPNWALSDPDDVKAEWAEWDDTWHGFGEPQFLPKPQVKKKRTWASSKALLTAQEADAYDGMTVWTEYLGLMGTPYPSPMLAYDPEKQAVQVSGPWTGDNRPVAGNRFFFENHPRFLDAPGEYWHDVEKGMLYLRLSADRDPNTTAVEIAQKGTLIDIQEQSHIHIEGLTFRFQRVPQWYHRYWATNEDPACVKAWNYGRDIRLSHNRFEHVVSVLNASTERDSDSDLLAFTDNDIRHCDYGAVHVKHGDSVHVLRNRFYDVGGRPRRAFKGIAVDLSFPDRPVVAGNIFHRMYGQAINAWGGKGSGSEEVDDLTRILIFENQVLDAVMTTNDYGNIETWQGGPAYVFNNVSMRPGGYWKPLDKVTNENYESFKNEMMRKYPSKEWPMVSKAMAVSGLYNRTTRNASSAGFAYSYYSDGGFKQYLFNNIGQGRSSDLDSPLLTTGAYHAVGGSFMLGVFNNTFHRFGNGVQRHGRYSSTDYIVGNTVEDIGDMFLRLSYAKDRAKQSSKSYANADPEHFAKQNVSDTLLQAVDYNLLAGNPAHFGTVEMSGRLTRDFQDMRNTMIMEGAMKGGIGVHSSEGVLRNPEAGDFRLKHTAQDVSQRSFIPWSLAATVGEWQFRRMEYEPERVVGEHWYMTKEYVSRGMYRYLPRHDLTASQVTADNYTRSPFESWIDSAMLLNGENQYLKLADADLKEDVVWEGNKRYKAGRLPAAERETPEMDTNDFLIEAVLMVDADSHGGLVSKADRDGYQLRINEAGHPVMELWSNGSRVIAATCPLAIADQQWHHLLVEVERQEGITFHLDGRTLEAKVEGSMPAAAASLANGADFLVGRDKDGQHLAMAIDFLRICKDDLAGARTSIEELYAWQFNGPQGHTWWGAEVATNKVRDIAENL